MSLNKQSEDGDQLHSRGSLDGELGAGITSNGQDTASEAKTADQGGYIGESALPEDRIAEARERDAEKAVSDNWHEDPRNPRLWPGHRKWAAAAVVSAYTFVS
ncbi:hypothetical protein FRC10_010890, partial [Ceratobasidium sp. 414]